MKTFTTAALPKIVFGPGVIEKLPAEIQRYARKALIVTGARSFQASPAWQRLQDALNEANIAYCVLSVSGEPSPQWVDEAVARHKDAGFAVVVGIGGGSALDAAKAVAGLLQPGNSVFDHLEGVGPQLPYLGPATPFIAVPTTAGTGSEVTKNAVLTHPGADGFKKSFRGDALVASTALVDPHLLRTCPKALVAADGMDAFTQLLESLTSLRANAMSEALAWSGLERFSLGFWDMWQAASDAPLAQEKAGARGDEARTHMAYASLMSGICLAQTGLGCVHGLAQPLGSLFAIPHGVVCGTLVAEATDINIRALIQRAPESPALSQYARVGQLFCGGVSGNDALEALVRTLKDGSERLALPRLSSFGVCDADVGRIVASSRSASSMKTNPVALRDDEIAEVVLRRL